MSSLKQGAQGATGPRGEAGRNGNDVSNISNIQSTPSKTDTFGTGSKGPSYRESNKGSNKRQGPTLGVRFREVSVLQRCPLRESRLYSSLQFPAVYTCIITLCKTVNWNKLE